MEIETIHKRIIAGNYLVKSHALQHALKEGFNRNNIVEAVMNGKIIELYPEEQRTLICGQAVLVEDVGVYLHIVCEYADPVFVEFVTAYIPDERQWENPPFRRRRRRR